MSLFNGRTMVEPIPHRPIIFLSQMPEWVDDLYWKCMVKENQLIHSRKQVSIPDRVRSVILALIGGGLLSLIIINGIPKINTFWDVLLLLLFFLGLIFPFIAYIINVIQDPERTFVYDRIKGTLTMPSNWFMRNNKTVTIPLKQVRYLIRPVVGPFGGVTIKIIFPKYKNPTHLLNITFSSHGMMDLRQLSNRAIRSELSVINWFMDRNRPLPPGLLFDPYREEDYLRRREEGFPFPLYESYVDTAEWEGAITKYKDKDALNRNKTIYKGTGKIGVPYDAL